MEKHEKSLEVGDRRREDVGINNIAAATRCKRSFGANLAGPTASGAPRKRQPSTSSTGMGGSLALGLEALEVIPYPPSAL